MARRYFAYGSNLCATQMGARCPAAREGEPVALPGWRFIINQRGVATLVPDPAEQVWGLLWQLTPACERTLDRYEGVARGFYRKEEMEVGGEPALVYLAAEHRPGTPREGYLEGILNACAARGIDPAYLAGLRCWAGADTHSPSTHPTQSATRSVQSRPPSRFMRMSPPILYG
ncbi:gamma-glutamylcyclotransferase family protein [Roseomonas sp. GCM10028921]